MAEVYVFFADGFEEIEGLTVVDLLRRAKVPVHMVSIQGKQAKGSHGIVIETEAQKAEWEAGEKRREMRLQRKKEGF